ncbi:MAG TPA: hypothetical protein VM821_07865, partial [Abditibacteriaceae bacterium]|nr:hypothetical protein [Abditibacteriaceae bacterium]
MKKSWVANVVLLAALICGASSLQALRAQETGAPVPRAEGQLGALSKMPVREITVFKDGYAFVLHEGALPTNRDGDVVLDSLPNPVLGTFWPYCSDGKTQLGSVVASRRRIASQKTALAIRELIEANIGAEVTIKESDNTKYSATILAVPQQSVTEAESSTGIVTAVGADSFSYRPATVATSVLPIPQKGSVVLLQNGDGVRAMPIERIQDITFKNAPKTLVAGNDQRNVLTMKLDWKGAAPATANVGMMYLQRGVRWIPNYRVTLNGKSADGKGTARVQLQATLLNEMTDLNDVTANLVIGAPSFTFKETPDPIALQDTLAQLSPYFQENNARGGFAFSNAIMTQQARMGEYSVANTGAGNGAMPSEISSGAKNEDLYLFTVRHLTLKKGERMTLPVIEYSIPYRDVYTLDLGFSPPAELNSYYDSEQQTRLAALMNAPKVMHKIRLTNTSKQPLTTAPVLILNGSQVLAQGMMTYASPGGSADVDVTTAVDVRVSRSDTETKRTPNAETWQNERYGRVDLTGKISLCNYRKDAIQVEVTRHVPGL